MRTIKELNKYKFLGKWVTMPEWGGQTYKCIGESKNQIYLWYKPNAGYDTIDPYIYKYFKYNDFIIDHINNKIDDLDSVITFKEVTHNKGDKIIWIK